jgi:hypothetical protein
MPQACGTGDVQQPDKEVIAADVAFNPDGHRPFEEGLSTSALEAHRNWSDVGHGSSLGFSLFDAVVEELFRISTC